MGKRARRKGIKPEHPVPEPLVVPEPQERPDGPLVVVGAPVAERGWILDRWLECLERQTVKPHGYRFVYSDSQDYTLRWLDFQRHHDSRFEYRRTELPFFSRDERQGDKADPNRSNHFAKLRNELRDMFLQTDADYYFSLDTDILLEDETVIERLIAAIESGDGWRVAQPLTVLHPLEHSACYNGGYFGQMVNPYDYDQPWIRADDNHLITKREVVKVDIPMAAVMFSRWALLSARYRPHEQGEDVGMAQSLKRVHCPVGWLVGCRVRHVWNESYLNKEVAA